MPAIRTCNSPTAVLLIIFIVCFCLSLAELKVGSVNQETSEAQQAFDRAEQLRANWTKADLKEAIKEYEKAALLWTSASDFSRASQATLNSGEIYFLFSDYREALKRFQNAEALADKAGDWLAKANAMSLIGRLQTFIGNNESAQQQLTKTLDLFKQHETDRNEIVVNAHGEALGNLAEVNLSKGDFVRARQQFKSALDLIKNDPRKAAKIHLFNGYMLGSLGNSEKARDEILQASEFYRQVNDKIGVARTRVALGLSHSHNKELDPAVALHNQAIEVFRAAGDRHGEAVTLNALGQAYEVAEQFDLALIRYGEALRVFEEIGSVEGRAATSMQLGIVHVKKGRLDQALPPFERALELARAAGKVRTEVVALTYVALINGLHGRRQLALDQYQNVLKFYAVNDLRARAVALNGYAEFLLQIKEYERALETCNEVLPLSEDMGDKSILIATLYNLSSARLALNSPDEALTVVRRSLAMIEDLREDASGRDVRLSYFSGARKHYELCIEILMHLDQIRPGQGFASEALLVSERGRARLLLDLILESGSRQTITDELLDRDRELRRSFEMQAQYRMDLFLNKKDPAEIVELDKQLAELKAEHQANEAKIRKQSPEFFKPFTPPTLQQIQNALDHDTMLLEYSLGNKQSYLWAVTANSFQSFQLPPRKPIEDAANELYKLLIARQGTEGRVDQNYQDKVKKADSAYPAKAAELSQMLLAPIAEQIGPRRLLVVTEGALQFIPLDSLPVAQKDGTSRKLLETNQVSVSPSISTLIAMRLNRKRTSSPGKLLAVIADPVFSSNDERMQGETAARDIAMAATSELRSSDSGLARLTYASEEADKISAIAPAGTTFVAKGFDATRETAMSSDIGQYEIVHFATHGFLDSQHPELSGIVLSTVDRNGNKINGVMPLHDIYSLNLSAELTVLSACQTALGKDIKGEGFVGLTHSFMSAGSNTVVASLWKVDDRATSVLMADFYESMFKKGMPPAEALRAAKLKLMQDPRWSAPYYWAGFVVQGEYRNRIEVGRNSWFRSGVILLSSLILIAGALLIYKRRKRRLPSPRSH